MRWMPYWTAEGSFWPGGRHAEAYRRASAGYGVRRVRPVHVQGYGKHVAQLRQLARAFTMLESEVGYSRATLPEGMIRVGNRLHTELGGLLHTDGKEGAGAERKLLPDSMAGGNALLAEDNLP